LLWDGVKVRCESELSVGGIIINIKSIEHFMKDDGELKLRELAPRALTAPV
jgi:hypothetical protein